MWIQATEQSKQMKYIVTDEKKQKKTIHIKQKLHMKQSKLYAHFESGAV